VLTGAAQTPAVGPAPKFGPRLIPQRRLRCKQQANNRRRLLARSFLFLVLGDAPRNDEAVTAAKTTIRFHARAAARDGVVA
jgi:hypothetical protein